MEMEGLPTLPNSSYLAAPEKHRGGHRRRLGPLRKPAPSYRHGTPSGPWPFLDIDDEVDPKRIEDPDSHIPMSAEPCVHHINLTQEFCWCKYPQSLYPNWTVRQQRKSRILKVIKRKERQRCIVYYIDVRDDGVFVPSAPREVDESVSKQDAQWHVMTHERPHDSRARVVFIDNLTGPALQMFGTRYNIEPFFFSSTISYIPSRFQSHIKPKEGDHVTLTLSFMRATTNPATDYPSPGSSFATGVSGRSQFGLSAKELIIDTQAPLPLRSPQSDIMLVSDFLAVHMVRRNDLTTTAETMYERFHLCGKSVYWSSIFKTTKDPTFLLLCLLWYVLYAWDEVFDALYAHICYLEDKVMTSNDLEFTQELHVIRAHLLHYESLMEEFRKTVEFVQRTENPALDNSDVFSEEHRDRTTKLIHRECENLLRDIRRLETSRKMQDKRLKNVMDLSFSLVNIEDSRRMAKLTEAAVRDSAAMKQIAYLTMFFLPAGFVATCFGMNITEINPKESAPGMTLAKYFAVAVPLTAVTVWLVVAYQIRIPDPRREVEDSYSRGGRDGGSSGLTFAGVYDEKHTGSLGGLTSSSKYPPTHHHHDDGRHRRLGFFERLLWPVWLFMSVFERRSVVLERARVGRVGVAGFGGGGGHGVGVGVTGVGGGGGGVRSGVGHPRIGGMRV
ncbi:hypothetical protein CC1G_11249 [Coprinopsis cinerea okayama7|uniref:Uncharacterized protein n=1 Tax=Coprinopsis cinerea (strain Okayama-7 / 130 / ATCC MYA-4618 / FGSC 9003) TaxID=240176 RepID=A8NLQ2_COPC7|nr:hypothetical protein CC1G_11249 [Coprinopsis cinerea okayama7\|eukprot:XP_001834750.2 hypothetical protein CC1G_11249 [Coprinopsis cinerea okayama7\